MSEKKLRSQAVELLEFWGYEEESKLVGQGEIPEWNEGRAEQAVNVFEELGYSQDYLNTILRISGLARTDNEICLELVEQLRSWNRNTEASAVHRLMLAKDT